MIFHNGALIEANSTMPTPVAMSTSEAKYMAACSATMVTAHNCMLLYDMLANTPARHATLNTASILSAKASKTVSTNFTGSCDSQLADILTKTQLSGKIDPHLTKIFCILPNHMLSSPTLGP
jgi:hypothetical protein